MAFLHKKKKEEDIASDEMVPYTPTPFEQVASLRQQGYTDEQILHSMQQQGYSTAEINEALQPYQQDYQYPQYPAQQHAQYPAQSSPQISEEQIQEVVEAVINEKWEELSKDIKAVIEWKERYENKLAQVQQQISDIRNDMQSIKTAVLGKVSEYDRNLSEVGTEIKAMEKVFQKVLPSLTESINKLERMSKDTLGAKTSK